MLVSRKIKVGKKNIQAVLVKLATKNLIVLCGERGYVMCGYLNLAAANKFKDVAVKITGVATIAQALDSKVHSVSLAAKNKGIRKGDHIKDVLKIIV
jgi:uncharacterized protein YunC (DUF1805 family)